jgi:hypothetical protein
MKINILCTVTFEGMKVMPLFTGAWAKVPAAEH